MNELKPNQKLAIQLAKRELSLLVYDAVNLEGVNMTLPEVQTLLDGITVGGHKISDQQMALNQADAWKRLFEMIENETFRFNKDTALSLHAIAGKGEALEWGCFRTGFVSIAGADYEPPAAAHLDKCWGSLEVDLSSISDIYDQAITAFLQMARYQFFWDVNKRMGRFMMNGILLSSGLPVINVPAKRQIEFNEKMLGFYNSNTMTEMNAFLRSCINPTTIKNFF